MTVSAPATRPWHVLRRSPVHGTGVFAARRIPAGTCIIEYGGRRISSEEADRRHPVDPADPFHTFFFALATGDVIDGGDDGNDARWINHSCAPNCEAEESEDGRIVIKALRDIARGQELNYDYGLVIAERMTKTLKQSYGCRCGAAECRGTMLAPRRRTRRRAIG